jgi:hypothetical protein
MSNANSKQVDGNHYKTKRIEPWDYIEANQLGFLEGSIIKYITRYQEKNGVKDLEKAKHFLEKLIEVRSVQNAETDNPFSHKLPPASVGPLFYR